MPKASLTLKRRRLTPERMDQPGLDPVDHAKALTGLARLNRLSGAGRVLWPAVESAYAQHQAGRQGDELKPFRVLDIACGSGDVTRGLALRSKAKKMNAAFRGCDIAQTAVDEAKGHRANAHLPLDFFRQDVLKDPLPEGYDLCLISLFLHHLSDQVAVDLLRMVAGVCPRLVVSDLHRSRVSRLLVNAGARLVTRSRIVLFDADASVCAAFTPEELQGIGQAAGLAGCKARRRFPSRLLLTWAANA